MADFVIVIIQLLLGAWIWKVQRQVQRREELEDKLREDRMRIYYDVVEPFMDRFKPKAASQKKPDDDGKQDDPDRDGKEAKMLGSDEYYWTAFCLTLIGSDGAIRAYNDLFQHLYHGKEHNGLRYASLLGTLLLEIRKSMGNEATEIDNWDMLEWFIIEARQLRQLDPLARSSASVGRGWDGFLQRAKRRPRPPPS